MKYLHKASIVEAIRFTDIGYGTLVAIGGLTAQGSSIKTMKETYSKKLLLEDQNGSVLEAELGDYIVRDSAGQVSVCKPDIFVEQYSVLRKE